MNACSNTYTLICMFWWQMCVSACNTWPYNAFKMTNHQIQHDKNKTGEDTKPCALLVLTSLSSTQVDISLQGCSLYFVVFFFFLFKENKNKAFKVHLPQNQISLFLTAASLRWFPHLQHHIRPRGTGFTRGQPGLTQLEAVSRRLTFSKLLWNCPGCFHHRT